MLPLYAAAIFTLGFWLSSSLAIVAMGVLLSAQRLSRREWLWLAAVAAVVPGLIIWVFDLFLAVKMPVAGGF
jgi:predicted membrane metal-binding protein